MATDQPGALYAENAGLRYRLMTLPDFRVFRELALGESPEWKEHYKDSLTRVESKPPGDNSTSLNIIRVRRLMPDVPPVVLYDQFHDADYRATWDDKMIEGFNIVQLDKHNDVGYYSAKFPWPLANRDFCNQRSWMEFTNGDFVIFNHSEPHSRCPVKKNFVRAKSILTGYFMQPSEDGAGTVLTYVTHSDPCGSIPHAVLNFAMTTFAPSLLKKCESCSKAYPEFCAKTYSPSHVFPWRTPKMDWNSTYLYPEDELNARTAAAAEKRVETLTDAAGQAAAAAGAPATHEECAAPSVAAAGSVAGPIVSLAPVAALKGSDGLAVQQYRAILQDAMNAVDRSFLREGRAPSTKEYVVRLMYALKGIRQTTVAA